MKTEIKTAREIPASERSTDLTTSDLSDESNQSDSVKPSQSKSNHTPPGGTCDQIRPYPAKSE